MRRLPLLALLVLALAFPVVARAHEILHAIERGKAVAVKAYFADGEVLAYTEYQIFSPADGKIPYQKGRTDRSGYLAFVPDRPGSWRVKVTDSTGHGLEVDVPVAQAAEDAKPAASGLAAWAFVARPLVGVALIALVFVGLVLYHRKKGAKK